MAPGTQIWSHATGGDVRSSPALNAAGTVVYVGSADYNLYAINTTDGTKIWNYTTGGGVDSSPALNPAGALVYVGSLDDNLYVVSAQ